MKKKDMTGLNVGKWSVLYEDLNPRTGGKARWICRCLCGNVKSVSGDTLRQAKGKRIGCNKCVTRRTNEYIDNRDGTTTVLCKNNKSFLIDTSDRQKVERYQWHVNRRGYVISGSVKPDIRLHRYLFDLPDSSDLEVDHKHGITTDHRRSELRVCKPYENQRNKPLHPTNTSGYKGVSYWKRKRKYVAEIVFRDENRTRHRKFLGYYDDPKEAAKVYDKAAEKYHGEYARTNKELGLLEVS